MRDLFLLDPSVTFLNHGSFGACPAPVFEKYQQWQRELETQPVKFLGRRSAELLYESRQALAGYMGTTADQLIYIPNATSGVNIVARSLDLSAGDEILTTHHEYGACDNTWNFVCERTGAKYVKSTIQLPLTSDDAFVENFWGSVNDNTRVIYMSHITSVSALILPVAEICQRARKLGIITVIDGAHAPGHIDLDLEAIGADFYTGNCHKWLCAPKGTAFLYARPEHHEQLQGQVISWGYSDIIEGYTGFDAYTGTSTLERRHQWQGTRDISGFLTVPDAIEFQQAHDWQAIRTQCHQLAYETLQRVCELTGLEPICDESHFGQMVAIPLPECDMSAVKNRLYDDYCIEVPLTHFDNRTYVRVAFQAYNTQADADKLIEALQEILSYK